MASHEQTTHIVSPSAPPEDYKEKSELTKMLQNQAAILQSLQHVTSKLDSMEERLTRVEKKMALIDAAPPPYSSSEGRGGIARSLDGTRILSEIRKVHDGVVMTGFYPTIRYPKVCVYGLEHTEGENTNDVCRKFMHEVLEMKEEDTKFFAFACRLPQSLGGGAGRPPPVVMAFSSDGRSKFLKKQAKKYMELREMAISVQILNQA